MWHASAQACQGVLAVHHPRELATPRSSKDTPWQRRRDNQTEDMPKRKNNEPSKPTSGLPTR